MNAFERYFQRLRAAAKESNDRKSSKSAGKTAPLVRDASGIKLRVGDSVVERNRLGDDMNYTVKRVAHSRDTPMPGITNEDVVQVRNDRNKRFYFKGRALTLNASAREMMARLAEPD